MHRATASIFQNKFLKNFSWKVNLSFHENMVKICNSEERGRSDISKHTLVKLSNSSSTQGVKSCRTTIFDSGPSPFSFSIPTRTRVSILALPVMRPIEGTTPCNDSSSRAEKLNIFCNEWRNWTNNSDIFLAFFFLHSFFIEIKKKI